MNQRAITKQIRMQMRKDIGNRVISPEASPPFHRGPRYLSHFACFDCRKSFKQDPFVAQVSHYCPECSRSLHEMGRNFRPPKKSSKNQWETARRLYEAGYRFFGSDSHSDPDLPTLLREVDQFIADNPNHYLRIKKPENNAERPTEG